MMTIFGAILSQVIMAKLVKMVKNALMAVMEWYIMATNMVETVTVEMLWPNQNGH